MKILSTALVGLATLLGASSAIANVAPLKGFATVLPVTKHYAAPAGRTTVTPLPSFTYTVTASSDLGGKTYSGTILGSSPSATPATSVLPVQIVPLIITIDDGTTTQTYDPTVADPCNGNHTTLASVVGSPIFTDNAYTMNGVKVGITQYIDAFQRAEFWSEVGGSAYHVKLKVRALAAQKLGFTGSANGLNYDAGSNGGCGYLGIININTLDSMVQALITGPLAKTVNAGTFPIFLTKDVVESESGVSTSSCCVLGYHSGFTSGSNLQIYSPFAYDSTGLFGASVTDVAILSHEMAEAVNDPTGGNPTPKWGHIGQVPSPHCQANFEVGDPLTGTIGFTHTGKNGLTYHMQELAFFSWYYGGTSLAAGGLYSDNGTFKGDAIKCTAKTGGTN